MEMPIYKLPLIVIVASPKWHSEQAMWPQEFQICGYFRPLPTGHVTRRIRSELLAFNMGKCKFEALYLPNGDDNLFQNIVNMRLTCAAREI